LDTFLSLFILLSALHRIVLKYDRNTILMTCFLIRRYNMINMMLTFSTLTGVERRGNPNVLHSTWEGGGREWARRFGLEVSNVCVSLCSSTQNELVPKVKSTLWVSISLKNLALTWNMRSINLPTGHGKF
jgi:hypothetical protein